MRNLDVEAQSQPENLYQHNIDLYVREKLIERFRPFFNLQDSRTLEIGSWEGDMTAMLIREFNTLDVLEGSSEHATKLTQKYLGQVEVHQGMLETFEPKAPYDNIFLVHTLEHLDQPVEGLMRLASWLSPNGRIFIAVPNANSLSRRIAVEMGLVDSLTAVTSSERRFGHTVTFNMDTLNYSVKKAGLKNLARGGVLLKTLANFQFDASIESKIISKEYLNALNALSLEFPDLSSSIYTIASR